MRIHEAPDHLQRCPVAYGEVQWQHRRRWVHRLDQPGSRLKDLVDDTEGLASLNCVNQGEVVAVMLVVRCHGVLFFSRVMLYLSSSSGLFDEAPPQRIDRDQQHGGGGSGFRLTVSCRAHDVFTNRAVRQASRISWE